MTNRRPDLSLRRTAAGVAFWVHVTPRARQASVGGAHGDALRVAVREPPVGGEANAACLRALARALRVPRSAVRLDPAARMRRKRVRIEGDPERLEVRLRQLAASRPRGIGTRGLLASGG